MVDTRVYSNNYNAGMIYGFYIPMKAVTHITIIIHYYTANIDMYFSGTFNWRRASIRASARVSHPKSNWKKM